MGNLIEIRELQTSFFTGEGELRAVDGVSFAIEEGRTMGLVGESGCGKSVTALSTMQLIPKAAGRIVGGEIRYRGRTCSISTRPGCGGSGATRSR